MKLLQRFTRPSKGDIALKFMDSKYPLMFDNQWSGYSIRPASYISSFITMRRPALFLGVTILPMLVSTVVIVILTTNRILNPTVGFTLYMIFSCIPGLVCTIASLIVQRKNTWYIDESTLKLIPEAENLIHSYCTKSYKHPKSENELAFKLLECELFESFTAYYEAAKTVDNQSKGKFTWTIPA